MKKKETFSEWLTREDNSAFESKADGYYCTIASVRKNADFDYLYVQRQYDGDGVLIGEGLQFAGIYCKQDGTIYEWRLGDMERDDTEKGGTQKALMFFLRDDVRRAVENVIKNDRGNLSISEIPDTAKPAARFDGDYKYIAEKTARNHFIFKEDTVYPYSYSCPYEFEIRTEKEFLEYILDPVSFTAAETMKYIESHQAEILKDFLIGDMIAAEYTAIQVNPLNPLHSTKRILWAMRTYDATKAKKVNVTILKDGLQMTFKTNAKQFREDIERYPGWRIEKADRPEFEKAFGPAADYGSDDIIRITHGSTVLYEAQKVKEKKGRKWKWKQQI
jgi:hypothetical protein